MTIHTIDLLTRDGARLSFECAEGQSLVAAANAANLYLPVVCGEGGCGACRATCRNGDYVLGPHSAKALPESDARNRAILLCRTFPRGPLTITAPFDRAQIRSEAATARAAEVVALEPAGERTVRLLLRLLDEGDGVAAEFEAGQYMELEVPGAGVWRAFSLANVGNWRGELEFFIRVHPDGVFSRWLESAARIGDRLSVRGPLGGFTLQERGLRPRWFVAGGTGLAPMLSMLRRMAEWQDPQPVRLYFGVGRESELFAAEELSRLKGELPQLHVTACVWQPEPGWAGFSGTPVDALHRDLAAAAGALPDIYLCGPPALIEAAEAAARTHGVPDEQIYSERFLPS